MGHRAMFVRAVRLFVVVLAALAVGGLSSASAGAAPLFDAVSCTAPNACTAVGYDSNLTLAARWDGNTWSIQSTPNPTGTRFDVLLGVSCISPRACQAVGYATQTAAPHTKHSLAERWDGKGWTTESTADPASASLSVLAGVSCSSSSACTAVGSSRDGALAMLADRWDGTSWAAQTLPHAIAGGLQGVSCPSLIACTAVGWRKESNGDQSGQAVSWNGSKWTFQTTPTPGTFDQLNGVSCPSVTHCAAIGESNGAQPFAEAWNGSRWSLQTTPSTPSALLNGVSCSTARACTAVGYQPDTSGQQTLTEAWDGSQWSLQTTPNAPGGTTNELNGVSCNSSTACTAVGFTSSGPTGLGTLALRWDGVSWSIEPSP